MKCLYALYKTEITVILRLHIIIYNACLNYYYFATIWINDYIYNIIDNKIFKIILMYVEYILTYFRDGICYKLYLEENRKTINIS